MWSYSVLIKKLLLLLWIIIIIIIIIIIFTPNDFDYFEANGLNQLRRSNLPVKKFIFLLIGQMRDCILPQQI